MKCWHAAPSFAPVWHITLTGTEHGEQPVQITLALRLPYVPDVVGAHCGTLVEKMGWKHTMAPEDHAVVKRRVQRYMANIMVLRQHFPAIYADLHAGERTVAMLPEWQAMVKRCDALQAQDEQPALVAMLYGPTGAGKSTLFRLLTGVQVPAGDSRRPMSYTCTLAVPQDIARPEYLCRLFPHFQLQPLQTMEQLTQPQHQTNLLLYTPYQAAASVPLILADVPDFDSIAQENWAQAEAMLERAEIVLFLVYGEGYANDIVVQALARGCRLAAQLAYVFTKTASRQAAQEKWQDLLQQLRKPDTSHGRLFQERRADGQTLWQFLADCSVYYSPRRVVNTCRHELQHVSSQIQQLQADLASVRAPLHDMAAKIAASEFPISRLVELVIKEAAGTQSRLRQAATAPFRVMSQVVSSVRDAASNAGKALFHLLRGASPDDRTAVRPWMDLERERLSEGLVADHGLFHIWRQQALMQSSRSQEWLTQERLENLRIALQHTPIPPPAQEWEAYISQAIHTWAQEHPWLCYLLPGLGDMVAVLGGAVFVVDLCTTGGLFGTAVVLGSMGTAGTAAVGGSAVGIVVDWLTQWRLENVIQQAQEHWRRQRTRELQQHLEQHLLQPLFRPWIEQLHALQQAPVATCEQACDDLDALLQEWRVAHHP